MGHYYFDSSALVKRYVAETGTNWTNGSCAIGAGNTLYTVRISGAEICGSTVVSSSTDGYAGRI